MRISLPTFKEISLFPKPKSIIKPQPIPLNQCLEDIKITLAKNQLTPTFTKNERYPIEVYQIRSCAKADLFLKSILERTGSGGNNQLQFIGLDTETDTHRQKISIDKISKLPSTIQIAFGEGLVAVFQIYQIYMVQKEGFPAELERLLKNKHISKVGVGVSNDLAEISGAFSISVENTLDLDKLGRHLNLPKVSLAALAYMYTGELIDKRKHHIFTRWDQRNLSNSSLQYAAYDALYSRLIYQEMIKPPKISISLEELKAVLDKKSRKSQENKSFI